MLRHHENVLSSVACGEKDFHAVRGGCDGILRIVVIALTLPVSGVTLSASRSRYTERSLRPSPASVGGLGGKDLLAKHPLLRRSQLRPGSPGAPTAREQRREFVR